MKMVIGIIVVLAIAAFLAVLTCKSKNSDLFKWIGIAIFIAFGLTWVFPYGQISSGTFYDQGMMRLGLSDIPTTMYYAIYFCITTVIYLLVLGGFYGVVSKTEGYSSIVKKISSKIKGKELLTTIITIIILVALTSFMKTALALLVFIPFIVSILLNAKYDKLTTMSVTFGSLLVGELAATYGTEGLYWFNNYLEVETKVGLSYRLIIASFALVLFVGLNVFFALKSKKKNKKSKNESKEAAEDLYEIAETKGKTKVWPTIVILSVLAVFVLLGYINWAGTFNVTCFDKFHEWLTGLTIGEDFAIFAYILGNSAAAFGNFEITSLVTLLLLTSVIVALINKMSLKDYMNSFGEGFVKFVKPTSLYVLSYAVFIVCYMSPFMAYVSDWAYGLTKNFNPYIATFTAFVTSIFHADLGYSAYLVGSILTTKFAADLNIAHTLYIATYGLVQVFLPTSGLLLLGLSYLKIDYKSWFKYIWMFVVAMLIVILLLATLVVY